MGDEVSRRTRKVIIDGITRIKEKLDNSIETEKERNDFLDGVPAIVKAIQDDHIEFKVYTKDKFHAKAYITHAKQAVIGSFALVGSSNFTLPGLTNNVELNVQIQREVNLLQEWFERHWEEAEEITPEILRVIERHTRDYTPFQVYAKSLQELFRGHEMTPSEWERTKSQMFPVLDQYQKEGYQALMKIARQYGGAFLCDGVGLGKTFIGLMVIERLIMHERKRVALFVPKAIRKDVWERDLRKYLPHMGGISGGDFSNLVIFNHTDLGRTGDFRYRFERIKEMADVIVIDEGHHFRNPGIKGTGESTIKGKGIRRPSRYRILLDIINESDSPKQLFLLTATPINNSLHDFRHMVELYTNGRDDYFRSTIGINSLRGHFVTMEHDLSKTFDKDSVFDASSETNLSEAEKVLRTDTLFRAIVVQRSRAYVKRSQIQEGITEASFPTREAPKVASYSIRKTYGRLLDMIEKAFEKKNPLFVLGIYYPLYYYTGPDETIDRFIENRQRQVVGLIRTQFLKRFESSAFAFERSCERLLIKLLTWVTRHSETDHEKQILERWKRQNAALIDYVYNQQLEIWGEDPEEADEDLISQEMLEDVEYLKRDEYKVEDILTDTYLDLEAIADFLQELKKFKPRNDDKLKALIELLKSDPILKKHKVLIFTEFADTAWYLHEQLKENEIQGVEKVHSGTKGDRSEIIKSFSPYYNDSSSSVIQNRGKQEIRVLISTDILSEGLNLQDATRLINYELHWNPVRLMQRIGRVDRRMDPEIEKLLLNDHPEEKELRGKVAYWNFLPPDELEELLKLYNRVTRKTLSISKTFGIEGKKLLTPEDDWDALREFNNAYEGTTTPIEEMHLEYQKLLKEIPDLPDHLKLLPGRVFSGKKNPSKGAKAVFFCYRIPKPDHSSVDSENGFQWTEDAGDTVWYLYDVDRKNILEDPSEIVNFIRSKPDTPRNCSIERKTLSDIRLKIEKHIKNSYLRRLQAPIGVKPVLKSWMELN